MLQLRIQSPYTLTTHYILLNRSQKFICLVFSSQRPITYVVYASAANRTRGPSMATMDFTTKPLMPPDMF
ncbi:hypothetical protein GGR53DRAFT_474817 [Hypoxylon sp. FL1150]|nr:hypothetical protein GGR53DRAFT_474817 [Hypoxylon sp. FL1150]